MDYKLGCWLGRLVGRRLRDWAAMLALLVILAGGLYMRLANLNDVQHWAGDGGRDYLTVMAWGKLHQWPLIGQGRITNDYTIGPGWFYTIAPALFLTHYNLAAGAGTVGAIGMIGIALAFAWVRRASGGALAALAVAALFSWSVGWVECQRECWNPRPLFFGLIAMTLLIHEARRRPLRCLALYLMAWLLLPQWHTTGWEAMLVSPPFMAMSLWAGRRRLGRAPRRAWIGWGLAVAAVFLALYLPPILYELKPGPGNMASYFANLLPGHKPGPGLPSRPWPERLAAAFVQLSGDLTRRSFTRLSWRDARWGMLATALLALVAGIGLSRRLLAVGVRRMATRDASALFLAALALSHGLLTAVVDRSYYDYFGEIFFPAPILLAGWSAGTLARRSRRRRGTGRGRWRAWAAQGIGLAIVAALFWQSLSQFPLAWGIHRGRVWHEFKCRATRKICDDVLAWAKGGKYSIKVVEEDGADLSSQFQALLWRDGHRPANRMYYGYTVKRKKMGRVLFVVTRESAARARLDATGLIGAIAPPTRDQDAVIYRILPKNLPPGARAVRFDFDRARGVLALRPVFE